MPGMLLIHSTGPLSFGTFVFNGLAVPDSYLTPTVVNTSLILQGSIKSDALYSKGGDPFSMLMYTSALMPLIQSLSNPTT